MRGINSESEVIDIRDYVDLGPPYDDLWPFPMCKFCTEEPTSTVELEDGSIQHLCVQHLEILLEDW